MKLSSPMTPNPDMQSRIMQCLDDMLSGRHVGHAGTVAIRYVSAVAALNAAVERAEHAQRQAERVFE